ncbi:MAG: bifunctional methylenetetrahydrofolate dehydrogenase/methenyltetrahydrofolate cyclohydrolase FolD [Candidatus Krumholzibacteriia bacterium]
MKILDGKAASAVVQERVKGQVSKLSGRPVLTLVQVGEDPASAVYVRTKIRMSEQCGIESRYVHLPDDVTEARLVETLGELSGDASVNGILLQLPLPPHIDQDRAVGTIAPIKDVDGFHPENLGLLASGRPRFVPCTPLGIVELMAQNQISTSGKRAAVLGRSIIVGKPISLLLALKGEGGDATVTICHSRTADIAAVTREADIVIAAMGQPHFVTADMVKQGAVVIDVGINRIDDASRKRGYRLVGDVDFAAVSDKASAITPVPGGVGPMTVAMLMSNTLKAFSLQAVASNALG